MTVAPEGNSDGKSAGPRKARLWAWAAFVPGVAYALVSIAWGFGSTWGLSTVGGALERAGRARNPSLIALLWLTVLLKLAAATLGLLATPQAASRRTAALPKRPITFAAWTAAVILTVYGGILTLVGLIVQADIIHAGPSANHRALAWHAYLWDPWFLVWGALLTVALWQYRGWRRASSL